MPHTAYCFHAHSRVDVRVLSEQFCDLDEWDGMVQRLKVIVVLPQCSLSALNDPVNTIHSEHGGMKQEETKGEINLYILC